MTPARTKAGLVKTMACTGPGAMVGPVQTIVPSLAPRVRRTPLFARSSYPEFRINGSDGERGFEAAAPRHGCWQPRPPGTRAACLEVARRRRTQVAARSRRPASQPSIERFGCLLRTQSTCRPGDTHHVHPGCEGSIAGGHGANRWGHLRADRQPKMSVRRSKAFGPPLLLPEGLRSAVDQGTPGAGYGLAGQTEVFSCR
jgi:hypothetical protein